LIDSPRVDPQFDPNAHFLLYWDRFLQKNAFSQQGILSFDIKQMVQSSSSGIFLRQSVLALGALTATKLNPHHRLANYRLALTFYNEAVIGLRNAIEYQTQSPEPQLAVLWTTMLLGLFEVSFSSTILIGVCFIEEDADMSQAHGRFVGATLGATSCSWDIKSSSCHRATCMCRLTPAKVFHGN
jgi:hypothetical protein